MLQPTRLGTAYLQLPADVERNHVEREGTVWLGRSPFAPDADAVADDGQALGVKDDTHVLLVGGTGKGKGTSIIVPNLCLWPGFVVCIYPKSENAMLTADARSEGRNGHPQLVHVLDPFAVARIQNEALRASFNPLWELMDEVKGGKAYGAPGDEDYEPAMIPAEDAVDEAQIIASDLVVDGDEGSNNEFWNTSARRMIAALILHFRATRAGATWSRCANSALDDWGTESPRLLGSREGSSPDGRDAFGAGSACD
jgi:type IV secretion system protein VirD4